MLISKAMMPITTKSSTRVNPRTPADADDFLCPSVGPVMVKTSRDPCATCSERMLAKKNRPLQDGFVKKLTGIENLSSNAHKPLEPRAKFQPLRIRLPIGQTA